MEARWCESDGYGLLGQLTIVVCLSFCWRDITNGFQKPVMVEPGYPYQGGQFNRFSGFPGAASMDDFRLVETVDGFRQGIVVAVAFTADRGLNAGLGQAAQEPRAERFLLSEWWMRASSRSG